MTRQQIQNVALNRIAGQYREKSDLQPSQADVLRNLHQCIQTIGRKQKIENDANGKNQRDGGKPLFLLFFFRVIGFVKIGRRALPPSIPLSRLVWPWRTDASAAWQAFSGSLLLQSFSPKHSYYIINFDISQSKPARLADDLMPWGYYILIITGNKDFFPFVPFGQKFRSKKGSQRHRLPVDRQSLL